MKIEFASFRTVAALSSYLLQSLALSLLIPAISPPAFAKDLFKYQDENGQWIFTDRNPAIDSLNAENLEKSILEFYEPSQLVKIQNNGSRNKPSLYAINASGAPAEVEIIFTKKTRNVKINGSSNTRRAYAIVPPRSERLIARLEPLEGKKWRYRYKWKYAFGEPVATELHDTENYYAYRFPYPEDLQFRITQSFNGKFSHQSTRSKFAVDITMPEGTPILAARDGVVVDFEDVFFRSGTTDSHYKRANYVRIIHNDGTIANYVHLQLDSVLVNKGDVVVEGQVLGKSGNTGYSTGPHLHFSIHQNQGLKLVSIPFRFHSPMNKMRVLPTRGHLLK